MNLILKIKSVMEAFLKVKIVKIHRKANKNVNDLAKYTLNLE